MEIRIFALKWLHIYITMKHPIQKEQNILIF